MTQLDLVFDDDWSVYESYLADYCPNVPEPGGGGGNYPDGGGGYDGNYGT